MIKFFSIFVLFFYLAATPVVAQDEEGEPKNDHSWVNQLSGPANATPAPEVTPASAGAGPDTAPPANEAAAKAGKPAAEGEDDLTENQKELLEIDKMLKEKGTHAVLTDPTIAKKMLKAFSKGKGKNMKPMSPFSAMPEKEIEGLVFKQSEGTAIHDFLKKNPKVVTFIVRFFKSEEAFFGLIKIASQDKKMKLYFGTFVFLTLLSFLFNMMGNRKSPFWKRFLRKIFVSLFITLLQFVALYFFFGEELQPTIQIAKEVFLTKG